MPIQFNCPNCGFRVTAPDSAAGLQGKCPKCGQGVPIPAPMPAPQPQDLPVAAVVAPPPKAGAGGLAVAGLVFGIVALAISLLPCVGWLAYGPATVGLILAIVALATARGAGRPRGVAVGGLVCSLIVMLWIPLYVFVILGLLVGGAATTAALLPAAPPVAKPLPNAPVAIGRPAPAPRSPTQRPYVRPMQRPSANVPVDTGKVNLVRTSNIPSVTWRLEGLAVLAAAFSPDGRLLSGCGGDGSLRVWDTAGGTQLHREQAEGLRFSCLAFSPDGRLLAAGTAPVNEISGTCSIFVNETAGGKPVHKLDCGRDHVAALAFSASGQTLISVHERRMQATEFGIRAWEAKTGQMVGSPLPGITGLSLSLSRKSGRLYVGRRGGISVIHPDTGQAVVQRDMTWGMGFDSCGIAISPDEQCLVGGQQWGGGAQFDPATLKDVASFGIGLRRYGTDAPRAMTFSPDGAMLACATRGDMVHLWSAGNWQLLRTIHPNGQAVAFSPDGRWLVNAGNKGLEVRDLKTLIVHHPVADGLIDPTGFWRGGGYTRVYLNLITGTLDGWWEDGGQGPGKLKGEGKPSVDGSDGSVFECTWTSGNDKGVGRFLITSQGSSQTAVFTRWAGSLRRGQPLSIATLVPTFGTGPAAPPGR